MKNKYSILVLLFSLIFAFDTNAQITISESDLPEAGYTYIVSCDTLTAVNLGTPGATAQSWDYSSLLEHYFRVPTYDSTNNTPYAADFLASTHYTYGPAIMYSGFYGGAPVGTQGMNYGYMFWRRDNTGFWIVGFRSQDGDYANKNVLNNPQELLIGTPATYGTVFNNSARWELVMDSNPADVDTLYVNTIEKILTSDAFGDLTTPNGNYPDVLRIHEYIVTVDSIYATMLGNPVYEMELNRDTLNNYIFMDNVTNYPLCIVHADKNNVVKSVEYYKGYSMAGIESSTQTKNSVYPNPSTGAFTMNVPAEYLKEGNCILVITDLTGKIVLEKKLISEMEAFEIIGEPGVYFYSIKNGGSKNLFGKIILTN